MDKYRAWDKLNDKMKGVCCVDWYIKQIVCTEDGEPDYYMDFEDIKLMRFTGIVDKNGKEIYEGDILHWKDKSKAGDGSLEENVIVYWSNDFLAWTVQGNDWSVDEPPHYLFEYKDPGEIEVIGNIYEGVLKNEA